MKALEGISIGLVLRGGFRQLVGLEVDVDEVTLGRHGTFHVVFITDHLAHPCL